MKIWGVICIYTINYNTRENVRDVHFVSCDDTCM